MRACIARAITLTAPGGATATTSYSGLTTTVTDPAGKKRQYNTNALRKLERVVEDPGGALNYFTDYVYDPLGNLTTVVQSGTM